MPICQQTHKLWQKNLKAEMMIIYLGSALPHPSLRLAKLNLGNGLPNLTFHQNRVYLLLPITKRDCGLLHHSFHPYREPLTVVRVHGGIVSAALALIHLNPCGLFRVCCQIVFNSPLTAN